MYIKMQRIKLGKPYQEFIHNLIESGYYGTATEVIWDAFHCALADTLL